MPLQQPLGVIARTTAVALLAAIAGHSAWADKPDWAGQGKNHSQNERRMDPERGEKWRNEVRQERGRQAESGYRSHRPMVELRFSNSDRRWIHDYYDAQMRSGHCPPGLAKKRNGCLPPGQAKAWTVGRPLSSDLRRYPLPPEVLIRLPIPPAGHEFVRVASDILLIAVGSSMVIDAIEDLGR